jgi:hypothetical protein
MSDGYHRRPGELAVWWHENKGPRGDHAMAQDVSGIMGARAVSLALKREPERYHAVRVMRWNGEQWVLVKNP